MKNRGRKGERESIKKKGSLGRKGRERGSTLAEEGIRGRRDEGRNLIEWVGGWLSWCEQRMNERMNERGSILPQATLRVVCEVIRMTKQSENAGF